jgi:predicted unusual protein kinase regulating ubiquinone biosynthesis (AarF/ABC1/UbiB family)
MARKRTIVAGLLAALGAAGAGYLAVKKAGTDKEAEGPKAAPTSRAARNLEMARVGTQAGASFAAHRARRAFASAERKVELDAAFELKTAEQVAAALGNMKGALMKVGQMASYLDQGLPEPVREQLAQLQSDAPPMAPELAAAVVRDELGAPPDEIFAEWDPTPIAAASIGQVHRAITRDDRAVAVKVQYPGIADAIRSDLANADLLFGGLELIFPGMDSKPIVEEIKERVVEELDYRIEADNQRLFADYYRDHPFIHVPDVLPELSTGRVLTSELATGDRLETVLTWSEEERGLAAEAIYRYVFRSLYRLHAFNGDPHPGNYLFRPGGQVTFLDYGMVKRFTAPEVSMFERMVTAMVLHEDIAAYRELLAEEGLLRDHARFSDDEIGTYFRHFYEFVLEDRPMTLTPEWSSESVRRFFDPGGPYGEIAKSANLTRAFVIIQRINLGLGAILGDLRATRNWRRIGDELWPFVDGPPSTPMGEAEAAWLATHPHPDRPAAPTPPVT